MAKIALTAFREALANKNIIAAYEKVTACINSSIHPEHLVACDRLIIGFRSVYSLHNKNARYCKALCNALQMKRIQIVHLQPFEHE